MKLESTGYYTYFHCLYKLVRFKIKSRTCLAETVDIIHRERERQKDPSHRKWSNESEFFSSKDPDPVKPSCKLQLPPTPPTHNCFLLFCRPFPFSLVAPWKEFQQPEKRRENLFTKTSNG